MHKKNLNFGVIDSGVEQSLLPSLATSRSASQWSTLTMRSFGHLSLDKSTDAYFLIGVQRLLTTGHFGRQRLSHRCSKPSQDG